MIAVRIPKEIRSYEEKLLFGLTVRQLLFTCAALIICIPMYIYGKKIMDEELVSWLIMLVALPCGGLGFIKYNGMPFEAFLNAIIRQMFLYPAKRKLTVGNCFREWQEATIKEDRIRAGLNTRKGRRKARDEGMYEAYQWLVADIIREKQAPERPDPAATPPPEMVYSAWHGQRNQKQILVIGGTGPGKARNPMGLGMEEEKNEQA